MQTVHVSNVVYDVSLFKRCVIKIIISLHVSDSAHALVTGSLWEVVGDVYRVTQCRAGFVIVRGSRAEADHCFPCPVNRYLADTARYYVSPGEHRLVAATADEAALMCRSCEPGLLCMGGDSVLTQEGYWRLDTPVRATRAHVYDNVNKTWHKPSGGAHVSVITSSHRRGADERRNSASKAYTQPNAFKVFRCAVGVCLNNGTCAPGRHGPVCGLCLPGYVHSLSGCVECLNAEAYDQARSVVIAMLVLFFAVVWFLTTWWPLLFQSGLRKTVMELLSQCIRIRQGPRVSPLSKAPNGMADVRVSGTSSAMQFLSNGGTVYIKNSIGFFQLIASLGVTFHEVDWGNLTMIVDGANIFSFEIFSFPDIACLTGGLSFTSKLIIVTAVPGGVCLLLAVPSAVTMILGRVLHGGWNKHPRHVAVLASFYYWVNIWLFIMYLPASMVCLSAFQCRRYGNDWLLVTDMREVRAYGCVCLCACSFHTHMRVYARTHMHARTHTRARARTHTQALTHTHTYLHTS